MKLALSALERRIKGKIIGTWNAIVGERKRTGMGLIIITEWTHVNFQFVI